MRHTGAFTLVEMLVVIAIIGVLAGLILPALSTARSSARKSACSNSLGQIGKSIAIYHNSNSEYFPSYANYGSDTPTVDPYPSAARMVKEYQAKNDYDRLSSRHMVIAYSSGHDPAYYDEGHKNFTPNGLGVMLKQNDLREGNVLMCPAMKGRWSTHYGHYNSGWVVSSYAFEPSLWRRLGTRTHMIGIESGEGHWVTTHGASEEAVALLSTYSYRLQPFFWGSISGGAWLHPSAGDELTVTHTKPVHKAQYMCPPFKTARQLGLRAVASDSFDIGLDAAWDGVGLGAKHHENGYNVLYGDAHVKWYPDETKLIARWDHATMGGSFNDTTISSPAAQEVWHAFDLANEADATD